jgi:L-ascorbate metabolism protein UlaG (beta-lactamase superfamily)
MLRTVSALALLLAMVAAAEAQPKDKERKDRPKFKVGGPPKSTTDVRIRWHGQSFFEIVTPKGTRIVTDPHNLTEYGRKEVETDLVLMSHFHTDHTAMEPITNAKKVKVYNALKKEDREGKRTSFNVVDTTFREVHIQTMGTYHDSMGGVKNGLNGVWIIDVAGFRIVHLGDLGHMLNKDQLKKLGKVDVLMIPVGGVYALNGIDAQKVVEQIKPRRWVLPMHYGTYVFDDLLPIKYFTDEQPEGQPVKKFKPNEWLSINPKTRPPKTYTLGILHW